MTGSGHFFCPSQKKLSSPSAAKAVSIKNVRKDAAVDAVSLSGEEEVLVLTKKAEVIKARADKLGEPSPEEEAALKAKHGPQMEAVGGKMMKQMMRLMAKPEAMAVIQESMAGMNK